MKWVEKTAKTVDEAVDLALKELGIPREKAEVIIIDEGSKGILGIIGARPARVKVIVKQTPEEKIEEFLKSVLANMDVKIDRMDMVRDGEFIKVNLFGKNTFKLIGKDGEVLDALQFLTGVVVNRGVPEEETVRILLDCQNFRKRKEERLKKLALSLADKVARSKKSIKLRPMTPYERRIIHTTLQNHKFVTTYSEGEEPYRKVVITLK
ncbi:single-stranded nucleic acid binding R3H domain-containing protein [Caldicellulosiruptor owensensis OL]|uniref:RNA-binding protein KhpB n=1 Tax=Caldicellulosiruptor owensensis (strain ATCC 700167 / DSM 13100 / OL) TaxID=632518 RepID=E4Q1B0_CALOW|nr:RNA-binding cell elongation regulator Jag/EloR [Caldicellulosiruptor owensensis]ADQ05759.1 single-stranded nucleic acid binding R3H domain-containing protein [Caldicellulosiruptor owensensis OL]